MPIIAELSVLFTANDSGFQRTNTAVQKSLAKTSEAAEDTSTWIGLLERAIADLSDIEVITTGTTKALATEIKSLGKSAAALDKAMDPAKVSAYSKALGTLDGVGSALAVEFAELQKIVSGLNRTFNSKSPEDYGTKALASATSVDTLALSAASAEAQILALNQQLAATRALVPRNINVNANSGGGGRGLSPNSRGSAELQVGRTLTRTITMPILAAGAASVVLETQFGAAMAKIEALSGIPHDVVKTWEGQILSLSETVGVMPVELAKGMFFIANEIKEPTKAMEVLTNASKMAAIGMGDTADNAKALTFVMHDYQNSNMTAAQAADVLTAATRVGNFSTETLTSNLGKLLPIASDLHIPFNQIAGAIAAMTKEGATVPQATTGIARLLQNINKPPKDALAAYKEMGTSAKEVAREMQTDLFGALVKVKQGADAHHVSLTRLFTTQNSWKAALAILGSDLKDSRQPFDQVADSVGALGKAFGITDKDDLQEFKKTLASLEVTGIKLGKNLSPMVRELSENIRFLSDQFSHLPAPAQAGIVQVMLFAAAAGPLISTVGLLTKGVGLLGGAFTGLSTVGIITKLGLVGVAIAEVTHLFLMAMDVIDQWNAKNAAVNLANSQPINSFSMSSATVDKVTPGGLWGLLPDQHEEITVPRQGYLEKRRYEEETRARKDLKNYDSSEVFHMPASGRTSEKDIYQEYLKTKLGKDNTKPPYVSPRSPSKGYGLEGDDPESGKPGKQSQAQKKSEQRLTALQEKLTSLAQATRLYGKESDAASDRDELLYGQFATDAQKAQGLAIALRQLTKAQRDSAARDVYGKSFDKLNPTQKQGAELVALERMNEARKKSAEAIKAEVAAHKALNDELVKGRASLLASKATTDEDRISYEQFQKPFASLSDADHRKWVTGMAALAKDKQAASVNVSDVQFDTGPNPQDARDKLDSDVQKANISVLIAKATSDEDAIALERYGKAFAKLTDPEIIAGVRALATAQKDLKAKVDVSEVKFDDGSEFASKMKGTYLEALHTLNKEISDVGKQTDAVRVATLEWDDAGAQMGRRMTHDQAVQLAALQAYLVKLKQTKAETDALAEKGASLLSGGAQHIFDHGFKGIGNYFKTESKNMVQGMIVDDIQKQAKGYLSGLLGGKEQDKNAQLVAAINAQIQALNANTTALGGTTSTGGIGAGAGALAGIPGAPSWLGNLGSAMSLIPGHANGGDYGPGPFWVGENGPEIINPGGHGTVTPNHMLGGETHVHHNYGPVNVHFHAQDGQNWNPRTANQNMRVLTKAMKEGGHIK